MKLVRQQKQKLITRNNIQLVPKGEVNSGGYIQTEARSVELYIERSSPTLTGIVVFVFTKSVG